MDIAVSHSPMPLLGSEQPAAWPPLPSPLPPLRTPPDAAHHDSLSAGRPPSSVVTAGWAGWLVVTARQLSEAVVTAGWVV